MKIAMKQLERRLVKLEAWAAASAKAKSNNELVRCFDRFYHFLTDLEQNEFMRLLEELGENLTLEQLQAHPSEIILRSTTRRERYPLLWRSLNKDRSLAVVAEPWDAEAEIKALRSGVAISWELRGLALVLDTLTIDDLTIIDHLRSASYWRPIVYIATPAEIELVLAKVQLDARAATNERDKSGFPIAWEEVHRPLTWADLKLNPATFPWDLRRELERYGDLSRWRRSGPKPSPQDQEKEGAH